MAIKPCRECGAQVSTEAKKCPHCGTETPTTNAAFRQLAGVAAAIVLFFVFYNIFFGGLDSLDTAATDPESFLSAAKEESSKGLVVEGTDWKRGEYGNLFVTGKVQNTTSKHFSYVQVEINLYGKDGAQVGSTMANVNNLEPNATWNFEAPVIQENVERMAVQGVTAF